MGDDPQGSYFLWDEWWFSQGGGVGGFVMEKSSANSQFCFCSRKKINVCDAITFHLRCSSLFPFGSDHYER